MARLRAPDGCPWDREQNFHTISRYLLEETYEVLEAIDDSDWPAVCEELGDLLLQPVFFAQMAQEEGHFDIAASVQSINEKLIRRHPHIFGDVQAETADKVLENWNAIKKQEKAAKGQQPAEPSIFDGLPKAAPALSEAKEISKRAAAAGFDWSSVAQVVEKLREELGELEAAGSVEEREGEIGDLLFVVVNLARFYKVDPEQALRLTNRKFKRRFGHVEAKLRERGQSLEASTIEEMEELWQQAKALEPKASPNP